MLDLINVTQSTSMIALGVFVTLTIFIGSVAPGSMCADYHYKTYKGNQPLHIVYGMAAVVLWATVVVFIFEKLGVV